MHGSDGNAASAVRDEQLGRACGSANRDARLEQACGSAVRGARLGRHAVVKIFVHRQKPERNEQTRDVQRCTSTCCICILSIVISMVLEMHLRICKV